MTYKLVLWPFVQELMDEPWFNSEAYLLQAMDNQEHHDSAYFIPLNRYDEFYGIEQK